MGKRFFLLLFLFVFLLLLFIFSQKLTVGKTKAISIRNHKFTVEVADTDTLRVKGLSGRKNLDKNSGMLFVFQKPSFYSFWMKGMNFPLDFIWINDETIVDLTENVPISKEDKTRMSTYTSGVPVDKVLEVKAGTVESLKIVVGDKVEPHAQSVWHHLLQSSFPRLPCTRTVQDLRVGRNPEPKA